MEEDVEIRKMSVYTEKKKDQNTLDILRIIRKQK